MTDISEDPKPKDPWDNRSDLRHHVLVQVRYHKKRQRWWDVADKLTKTVTIVLGATLFGQYIKDTPAVGVAVSVIGLLALIFGYSERKQLHKELAEQETALAASIVELPAGELTAAKVARWTADHLRICMKAPPPLKALTLICEREQAVADGEPSLAAKVNPVRRLFAHIF